MALRDTDLLVWWQRLTSNDVAARVRPGRRARRSSGQALVAGGLCLGLTLAPGTAVAQQAKKSGGSCPLTPRARTLVVPERPWQSRLAPGAGAGKRQQRLRRQATAQPPHRPFASVAGSAGTAGTAGVGDVPTFFPVEGPGDPVVEGLFIGALMMDPALVDIDGDNDLDLVLFGDRISFAGSIRYLRNELVESGTATFTEVDDEDNPFYDDFFSSDVLAFADVDGDNDPDVIATWLDGDAPHLHYYRNDGGTLTEQTDGDNPFDGITFAYPEYVSALAVVDLDNDGDLDLVTQENPGGTYEPGGLIRYYRNDAGTFNEQIGATNPFDGIETGGSGLALYDFDGDGDLDLALGNKYGTLNYFDNTGDAENPVFTPVTAASNPFRHTAAGMDSGPAVGDYDDDGDLDLLLAGLGLIHYSSDAGTGTPHNASFSLITGTDNPFFADPPDPEPDDFVFDGTYTFGYVFPALADVDGDGDVDAFLSGAVYPSYPQLLYFRNEGGTLVPQAEVDNPFYDDDLGGIPGMLEVAQLAFVDVDDDGDLDALSLCGCSLYFFENMQIDDTEPAGVARFVERSYASDNPFYTIVDYIDYGLYATGVAVADLDNDGDVDVILGDADGKIYYFVNNLDDPDTPEFTLQTGPDDPFDGLDFGGYIVPFLAHLDGDGDYDLVVGNMSSGSPYFFDNTGDAQNPAFTRVTGAANPFRTVATGASLVPAMADLDGDGDNDLLVGSNGFFVPMLVSGTSLRYYRNDDATAPLPVELAAFEAAADGEAVVLAWQTASETNNAGFEVEHRAPGAPAFVRAGFVAGAGTTAEGRRYQYRLDAAAPGRHVFRLKQVDYDGAFKYSPEVEVSVLLPDAFRLGNVYPNPAYDAAEMVVSVREAQVVRASLYDVLGRHVADLDVRAVSPDQPARLRFDTSGLASGLYFVRVAGDTFSRSQPLLVQR